MLSQIKRISIVAALTLLLFAQTTHAEPPHRVVFAGAELTNVAANASAASRTMTLNVKEFSHMALVVALTHSTATAITVTIKYRVKSAGVQGTMHSLMVAGGAVTLSPVTYTKPGVTGDADLAIVLPVRNWAEVELIIGATGGGASDLINAQAIGTSGG